MGQKDEKEQTDWDKFQEGFRKKTGFKEKNEEDEKNFFNKVSEMFFGSNKASTVLKGKGK